MSARPVGRSPNYLKCGIIYFSPKSQTKDEKKELNDEKIIRHSSKTCRTHNTLLLKSKIFLSKQELLGPQD